MTRPQDTTSEVVASAQVQSDLADFAKFIGQCRWRHACERDEFMRSNAWRLMEVAAYQNAQLAALTKRVGELEGALEEAKDDTARLDYLDSLNAALNARHGTKYSWSMIVNANVNRVMFNFPRGADLSDYNPHGFGSCRGAIDQRMAETAAFRTARRLTGGEG